MQNTPKQKKLLTVLVFVVSIARPALAARVIYVDDNGPADFDNIQAAIDDANEGDTVIVLDGTYTGPGNYDIDFDGKAITVKSKNGPEKTIVDARNNGSCFHFTERVGPGAVLEGFTVTMADEASRGINCGPARPTILNCIVTGNRDGIACGSGTRITDCLITANRRHGISGSAIITGCTITHNAQTGIISVSTSPSRIDGCIIMHNARAINCYRTGLEITNCLIASNHNPSDFDVGGISVWKSTATISNCTIFDNRSNVLGAAIYTGDSQVTVRNSIVWGNRDSTGVSETAQICRDSDSGTILAMHNCIQGWSGYWAGTANIDADPWRIDPTTTSFRLEADSPCIDAGMNTCPPLLPETDLDGNFRQIDGDNDGVAVVDIGAYEFGEVRTPLISACPSQAEFVYRLDGPNPPPEIMSVRNIGTDVLNWQVYEECPWLQAEPTNGSSSGDINEVTLTVDAAGLSPGRYVCEVTIADDSAANSPVATAVALVVYAEGRLNVPAEFRTIQDAVDAAQPGDTVIVADGIYRGEGNRDIDFAKPITLRSQNGPRNCIIDCRGTPGDKHRGFDLTGDPNSILNGFTIINGHHDYGGAIYCHGFGSRPYVKNCIIKDNFAQNAGGGIYIYNYGCAILINCLFTGNKVSDRGGAMATTGRAFTINCIFTRNYAGKYGGAVDDRSGYATLINCILAGNSAVLAGGAVYSNESDTILNNCTLIGNSARLGGGIYCDDDTEVFCNNCILWAATDSGGTGELAQIWAQDTINLNHCCIQGWTGHYEEVAGAGNIGNYPCFADPGHWDPNATPEDPNDDFWVDGDYHLESQAGRYDPISQNWIIDDVTSPCIDSGHPMTPIGPEHFPNGAIVNIGAYGGTAEASKSYFGKTPCRTIVAGDINGDCKIDFLDFNLMTMTWLLDYNKFQCAECPLIED